MQESIVHRHVQDQIHRQKTQNEGPMRTNQVDMRIIAKGEAGLDPTLPKKAAGIIKKIVKNVTADTSMILSVISKL